ncbi:hypothetical protein NP233_g2152 [Leucocoprinus birnbaumii]|uniref:Zn(2)-C6 fungal-type domain-containing protein n=1 Tax=Leucocoprinus birnbaumii TaxID=56174 RepID=A0AAD5VYW1_9AGAR|nr:hypothetical protein NP233_g2152 [Leucocoprinus birnbaumii]
MPVDSSQPSQVRRTSRKLTESDEIDLRRARGEISCAECRRLKLKCDKKLPCSSCVRRGCPSICPNGSLSTGQGTRFVLADTAQLHSKIAEMGQRIRQLEDALAIFQSGVSNETHPLLTDDLLAIKFGPEKGQIQEKEENASKRVIESIDAIGTMTIGDHGNEGKYFGPSAGLSFWQVGAEYDPPEEEDSTNSQPEVSPEISQLSASFPFGSDTDPDAALEALYSYLPEQPRAWALCETYLEQASWTFTPIKRDEIINDILAPTYRVLKAKQAGDASGLSSVSPHKLAVLYLIFALGTLVDLTLPPYSKDAEKYHHLSRACLALRSIFDSPEVATVQTIILMASYHGMAGKRYTMDSAWAITSLGAKVAQSLGLHRDSARWNMDPKVVQKRRSLFWEMTSMEFFYSLALGRPPSIRLSYADCELPEDEEATLDENGNPLIGYYRWKYEFVKEILSDVIEKSLTAEAPQYRTILDLDRKLREKKLPPHLNVFMSPEEEHFTPSVYMRGCILGQFRAITLLYIHRSWFAQAMLDHPANPLRSPYAPSFLAAYRCASGVIKISLNHFDRFPELCCRWWGIWTHLFSAAIIVGSIITRSPSSSMAPTAFIELGLACDLFEKGATHSRRVRSGSIILQKLRQKAFQVYSQFRSGNPPLQNAIAFNRQDYGDDELALFGGQTRILVTRLLSANRRKRHTTTSCSASNSSGSTVSSPLTEPESLRGSSIASDGGLPEVHPSLVDYLSTFPPTPSNPTSPPTHTTDNTFSAQVAPMQEDLSSTYPNTWSNWQQQPNSTTRNSFPAPYAYQQATPDFKYASISSTRAPGQQQPEISNTLGLEAMKTDSPEGSQLLDMGMMVSGESGMDEQWMSFMRDSGIMDSNYASRSQGVDPSSNPSAISMGLISGLWTMVLNQHYSILETKGDALMDVLSEIAAFRATCPVTRSTSLLLYSTWQHGDTSSGKLRPLFTLQNSYRIAVQRLVSLLIEMAAARREGKLISGTDLVHGDSDVPYFRGAGAAVAPSISVSTTFQNPAPEEDVIPYSEVDLRVPSRHMYSRYTQENSTRAEHVLSKVLNGYALTYTSGLNAVYAAMIHFQPKRIALREGYHGCQSSIAIYKRSRPEVEVIDIDADFKPGDLCWIETPVNPYGVSRRVHFSQCFWLLHIRLMSFIELCRDIQYYANKIHQVGGTLVVDSTFGPPPLQDPFKFGADCIMHSVKTDDEWKKLHHDRTFIGCGLGSLEAWLLLRSLKTLHLRVPRQSETATALAKWLDSVRDTPKDQTFEEIAGGLIRKVHHSSLQGTDARGFNPQNQMLGGFNATFGIELATVDLASRLPHFLELFVPATSLGGVESLVEHRLGSDPGADPSLVRLSIGVEEFEDLQGDLRQALQQLSKLFSE